MAELPIEFPFPTEQSITTFDFIDLTTGTAFKSFSGVDVLSGAESLGYNLITNEIFGENGSTSVTAAAFDIDFDLDFERSLSLEGIANFNIWFAASGTVTPDVQINLKHVNSGGSETQIGTEVSKTLSLNNSKDLFSGKYTIPLQFFKPGEKLRVILTSDSTTMTVYHDPKNRDAQTLPGAGLAGTISTVFSILLPFRINR